MIVFFAPPQLFPNLKFFWSILRSDVWLVIDHQNYKTTSPERICRFKMPKHIVNVRIPVIRHLDVPQLVYQTKINNFVRWKEPFLSVIKICYQDRDYFTNIMPSIEYYIKGPCFLLETFDMQTTFYILSLFKKMPEIYYSKNYFKDETKKEVIDTFCSLVNGESLDSTQFNHPIYKQSTKHFIKNLSILDALFNIGPEQTHKILLNT